MTDIELLERALEDLEWAKLMLKLDGGDAHECLDESIAAIKARLDLIITEGCHPSHKTRSSDASSYDEICETCGATDGLGTWGELSKPCKADILKD